MKITHKHRWRLITATQIMKRIHYWYLCRCGIDKVKEEKGKLGHKIIRYYKQANGKRAKKL